MENTLDVTDEKLVRKAQAGDLEAEEELLRSYKFLAKAKANMYYMVGADEDDVLQEGMIGLLKAVRQYDDEKEASFKTFAGHCITNQIISAIRAADRNKHKPLNTSVSLEDFLSSSKGNPSERGAMKLEDTLADSPADSPEQMLVFKDIAQCIIHNDDRIFSEYEMQVLIELLQGKNRPEIARDLGRPEKSIDNCLSRIRKKVVDYINA